MLIVDSHCHTGLNFGEPIETLNYQMDTNGVSHTVLIQINGRYDNSYLLDCAKRFKNRFKAVVYLDPRNTGSARVKALEAQHNGGASGYRVNLRYGWKNDDPLFKAAGELGLIISVIGRVENFASTQFKELLDLHPKTHFCIEHLARSAKPDGDYCDPPHDGFKASLETAKWPNTSIKVGGLGEFCKRPRPHIPAGSEIFYLYVPPLFEMVLEAFGAQRMMWGSNFPVCAGKEGYKNALAWVRDYPAFQTGDDVSWIMGKTAARVWGFSD